jgi:hypothetical protein
MEKDKVIELGEIMGLSFNEKTNFPDQLKKGIVVFDGCNGQRFLINSKWSDKQIYEELGCALILYGKRQMKLELHQLLSITGD